MTTTDIKERWETVKVTRRRSESGPFAVMPDGKTYYCPEVILLQRNDTGSTRTVLGFRVGVQILAADEIEGWAGLLAGDVRVGSCLPGETTMRSILTGFHPA
jgi:hypothetical protein